MRRDDPGTWVSPGRHWPHENRWGLANNWMGNSPWPGPEDDRPGADAGERVGRLPYKLTRDRAEDVWRWHGIGHDPAFVAMTSAHPRMLHMVELLLGGPIKRPRRNRGIYAIFPRDPAEPGSRLGPHIDDNPIEMIAVMILEDIGPRAGGFTLYPGSARALYPTSAQALNRVRQRGHLRWTAAGKHGGPRINTDMDGVLTIAADTGDDPADGYREVTQQWIADSNEFVLDRSPPLDEMYRDWNLGQRDATGHVVDEPAWWEKYDLPLLPAGSMPSGGGGTPAISLSSVARYEGEGRWRVPLKGNERMKKTDSCG